MRPPANGFWWTTRRSSTGSVERLRSGESGASPPRSLLAVQARGANQRGQLALPLGGERQVSLETALCGAIRRRAFSSAPAANAALGRVTVSPRPQRLVEFLATRRRMQAERDRQGLPQSAVHTDRPGAPVELLVAAHPSGVWPLPLSYVPAPAWRTGSPSPPPGKSLCYWKLVSRPKYHLAGWRLGRCFQ